MASTDVFLLYRLTIWLLRATERHRTGHRGHVRRQGTATGRIGRCSGRANLTGTSDVPDRYVPFSQHRQRPDPREHRFMQYRQPSPESSWEHSPVDPMIDHSLVCLFTAFNAGFALV